jgi:hypothetical protein
MTAKILNQKANNIKQYLQKEKFVATYHQQGTFTFQVLDVASYFLFKTLFNYIKETVPS